jgi:hypothetical protein
MRCPMFQLTSPNSATDGLGKYERRGRVPASQARLTNKANCKNSIARWKRLDRDEPSRSWYALRDVDTI